MCVVKKMLSEHASRGAQEAATARLGIFLGKPVRSVLTALSGAGRGLCKLCAAKLMANDRSPYWPAYAPARQRAMSWRRNKTSWRWRASCSRSASHARDVELLVLGFTESKVSVGVDTQTGTNTMEATEDDKVN